MKLNNKIALITGGTSGIGLETAKLFQAEGATVIVTGTHPERLAAARRELGDTAAVFAVDLRQPAQIDRFMAQVRVQYGRLDVVFANAGAGTAATVEDVTPEQLEEQFSLNVGGVFFTIQKALPLMRAGGSIVATTSFLNAVGTSGLSILSATKAAVRSLVRSLGAELAPRKIRVNAVSPGAIATSFHTKLGLPDDVLAQTAAAIEASVPLKRFGEAFEVAKAALFLASDDGSYVNGAEVVVDGGLTQF